MTSYKDIVFLSAVVLMGLMIIFVTLGNQTLYLSVVVGFIFMFICLSVSRYLERNKKIDRSAVVLIFFLFCAIFGIYIFTTYFKTRTVLFGMVLGGGLMLHISEALKFHSDYKKKLEEKNKAI